MKWLVVFVALIVSSYQKPVDEVGGASEVAFSGEIYHNQVLTNQAKTCNWENSTITCCDHVQLLNVPVTHKVCSEVNFEGEEGEDDVKIYFDDSLVHSQTLSAGNPEPICVDAPNEWLNVKVCAGFDGSRVDEGVFESCFNFQMEAHVEETCFQLQKEGNRVRAHITNFQSYLAELGGEQEVHQKEVEETVENTESN